jgi:hypothetical protein
MELRLDPLDPVQIEETLRLLKSRHPVIWSRVADCPIAGLSVRTRSKLQEHCICTQEQLFSYTRQEALNMLGEMAIHELEDAGLQDWKTETDDT